MRTQQLTLWPRETLRHRIISRLLQHANSDPQVPRGQFYAMKTAILTDLAEPCGVDWQDVSRICYSCDGTGGLYEPGGCYKCEGSGIYRRVYVPLHRWRIGGRVFHVPGESQSRRPEAAIAIRGRIQHKPSRCAWHAALLLAVMYDRAYAVTLLKELWPLRVWREIARRWQSRCRHCGRRVLWTSDRWATYCSQRCENLHVEEIPF